jgi:pyruvate dehydrogenase E1 component alpha subunit
MPRRVVDVPEPIEFVSILDAEGSLDAALEPAIAGDDLVRMYRTMLHARRADERLVALQRQGRIGTFIPGRGQEAVALGAVSALRPSDWMVPVFRQLAAYLWRGWRLEQLILYLAGYQEGMRLPDGAHDLPLCVAVAGQLPHAVGLAYAARCKGEDRVVLVFLGDGATSHGDFHEAANFAGVFQLPVVFCCENNQWAISVPVRKQTRAPTLARKALGYGMPGIQVDGNDVLAVHATVAEAVARARAAKGPTFVECVTYRLGPHSTADDPRRYRSDAEVREWEGREPLIRFRRYLEARGLLDAPAHRDLEAAITADIAASVERAERAQQSGDPLDMFENVYADLPAELLEQRDALAKALGRS